MVEYLQNISKHANDDAKTASDSLEEGLVKTGIFLIGNDQSQYFITTGNSISNKNIPDLKILIDNINLLNQDELKQFHKQKMRETAISDKGAAGLGFIDIARKTRNPLEYHFERIDKNNSFFFFKTTISRS